MLLSRKYYSARSFLKACYLLSHKSVKGLYHVKFRHKAIRDRKQSEDRN